MRCLVYNNPSGLIGPHSYAAAWRVDEGTEATEALRQIEYERVRERGEECPPTGVVSTSTVDETIRSFGGGANQNFLAVAARHPGLPAGCRSALLFERLIDAEPVQWMLLHHPTKA